MPSPARFPIGGSVFAFKEFVLIENGRPIVEGTTGGKLPGLAYLCSRAKTSLYPAQKERIQVTSSSVGYAFGRRHRICPQPGAFFIPKVSSHLESRIPRGVVVCASVQQPAGRKHPNAKFRCARRVSVHTRQFQASFAPALAGGKTIYEG